jgi:hypothetical protein
MSIEKKKDNDGKKKPEPEDEWENCKGQCGYTPWCKDCETPQAIEEKSDG